jgi:hypothetical protein
MLPCLRLHVASPVVILMVLDIAQMLQALELTEMFLRIPLLAMTVARLLAVVLTSDDCGCKVVR